MYATIGSTSYISGDYGKYDNKIKNNSVRYGRNSVDNYKLYLSNYIQPNAGLNFDVVDFSSKSKFGFINKLSFIFKKMKLHRQISKLEKKVNKMLENETKRTPLDFVVKYMPGDIKDGAIDKQALMAAAYEEFGNTEADLKELESKSAEIENSNEDLQIVPDALDINQDGKVDLAEYSASILLEDALSSDTDELKYENINGILTKDGSNKSLPYYTKRNIDTARGVFSQIYNHYNLGEAKEQFLKNKNNLI